MSEALDKFNCVIECYCLMTNHTHSIITTTDNKICDVMRIIDLRYTKYFNKKYDLVGHLFQGRYSAELIDNNLYRVEASRYIHLNPVKARIVSSPEEYQWSSYSFYVSQKLEESKRKTLINVSTDIILSFFGNSRNIYKTYIEGFISEYDN